MGRVRLDLLAQAADVHRHGRLVAEGPAPDLLEQLVARERLAGVGQEEAQQVELARGEREPTAAEGGGVLGRVHDQVAVGDGASDAATGPLPGPPQDRVDPEHELARAERLGHVVVGAALEPDHPVGLGAEGGQHDHRQVVAAGAQPLADLETVDARQHQVEDHQVGGTVAQQCERALAVGGLVHLVPGGPQVGDHDLADRHVVIDHQYPCHRHLLGPRFAASSPRRR